MTRKGDVRAFPQVGIKLTPNAHKQITGVQAILREERQRVVSLSEVADELVTAWHEKRAAAAAAKEPGK